MIFVFARCEEYCASTMPSNGSFSVTTVSLIMIPLHILSTSSVFASAFSPFAPAAAAFSSFACAFISSLSACAAAFFVAAVLFKKIHDLLVFITSSGFLTSFFLLGRVPHTQSCRVFSCILMVVLSRHGDRESSHDTPVVTSHVDHVVGLCLKYLPLVSMYSISFSFPFGETKAICF